MKWEGDIYDERCGEYRIRTQFTHRGAFSTLYYAGRIIDYTIGPDEAKEKAEQHADKHGIVVADKDVSDEAQIELRAKVLASHK